MLDSLRSSATGIFAKILLAFLVLTFGIWGIGDMIRNPAGRLTIAKVGDATITSDEYIIAMRREAENLRRLMGDNFSPDVLKDPTLERHVLQQLINRSLLKQESEALGIVPGDADVVRRIRTNPGFQDEKGNFDKAQFEATLKSVGMSEKNYVETVRQDMASTLLVDTLTAVVPVTDIAAHTLFEARGEGRSVTLYSLKPAAMSSIPVPEDAQIKSYYDAHAHEFTAPEYRSASYVTIGSANVGKDVRVSEDELKTAYKERLDEFRRPEKRGVEQLLYSSKDTADKASALLKGGKSFEDVAKTTDAMNKNALTLGKVERGGVIESAADRVFSLKAGEFTEPVQSPFGWHIFKVVSIDPPSVASFEEAKPVLEKDMASRGADDALNKLANRFQDMLAGGSTLTEAAQELHLKVISVGPVDRTGKTPDGGKAVLPELDKFSDLLFKTDEKTDSQMATSKGGLYYLLHVDKITPEHVRTLDEVRELAATGWQSEERERLLSELAKQVGAVFAKPAERPGVLAKYNLQPAGKVVIHRTTHTAGGISLPTELVADAFARNPQGGTQAYATKNGDYLLATVDSVIPAPSPESDPKLTALLKDIHKGLEAVGQNEILEQHAHYLMQKYRVTINESALQTVLK